MTAYLKIENVGVCPPEGFTVLGVSLADTSTNEGVIGTFGSGSKHGVAVCLRNEIPPIVFSGTLKMEFSTRPQIVEDGQASKEFGRVVVVVTKCAGQGWCDYAWCGIGDRPGMIIETSTSIAQPQNFHSRC